MSTYGEVFLPGEIHSVDVHDPGIQIATEVTDAHLRTIGSRYCFDVAERAKVDPQTGIRTALVPPSPGVPISQEAAILVPGTFGNDVWAHKIAMGMTVADQAMLDGVRDRNGDLVGVLLFSAPSMETSFNQSPINLWRAGRANFTPIGGQHSELTSRLGFGAIKGVAANSQAAAFAAPIVETAAASGLDVDGRALLLERPLRGSLRALGKGFGDEGKVFKDTVAEDGIEVIDEIFATGKASPGFELGIVRRLLHSQAIFRGLARNPEDRLHDDIVSLAHNGVQATVASGSESKLGEENATRDATLAAWLTLYISGMKAELLPSHIELHGKGANHTLGDRLGHVRWLVHKSLAPVES